MNQDYIDSDPTFLGFFLYLRAKNCPFSFMFSESTYNCNKMTEKNRGATGTGHIAPVLVFLVYPVTKKFSPKRTETSI